MTYKATYIFICLIEECAELIVAICKAFRFGLENTHPVSKVRNIDAISSELDDIQGVATMLERECDITILHSDSIAIENKIAKVKKFIS